jgi:hypothetical protein
VNAYLSDLAVIGGHALVRVIFPTELVVRHSVGLMEICGKKKSSFDAEKFVFVVVV